MVNSSKAQDPRFWTRWRDAGAIETYADAVTRSVTETGDLDSYCQYHSFDLNRDDDINLLLKATKVLDAKLISEPTSRSSLTVLARNLANAQIGWRFAYGLANLESISKLRAKDLGEIILQPILDGMQTSRAWGYGLATALADGRAYSTTNSLSPESPLGRRTVPFVRALEGKEEVLYSAIRDSFALPKPTGHGLVASVVNLGDGELHQLATDLFMRLYSEDNLIERHYELAPASLQRLILGKATREQSISDVVRGLARSKLNPDGDTFSQQLIVLSNTGLFTVEDRGGSRSAQDYVKNEIVCSRRLYPSEFKEVLAELDPQFKPSDVEILKENLYR